MPRMMLFGHRGNHFARQVRKKARVNFHVPFSRECHGSEMLACTCIGELGRDLDRALPQFPSVSGSSWLQWNYAISASDEKFDRNATAGNNRPAALEPILTSARVSIDIPELLTLTAVSPARILRGYQLLLNRYRYTCIMQFILILPPFSVASRSWLRQRRL